MFDLSVCVLFTGVSLKIGGIRVIMLFVSCIVSTSMFECVFKISVSASCNLERVPVLLLRVPVFVFTMLNVIL